MNTASHQIARLSRRASSLVALTVLLFVSATFSAELSFLYDGCTVRLPARVDGQSADLIFDTGSTISALDKTTFLSRLGDSISEATANSIAGEVTLDLYRSPEILVDDIAVGLRRIAAVDLSTVRAISGSECDGILGIDFARERVIGLDFDHRLVSINRSESGLPPAGALCLPMKPIGNGNVAIDATVEGVPVTFMIDTGDNGSISLNPTDWQRVLRSHSTADVHTILASAVSGKVIQTSGLRVSDLVIGANHYTGFVATEVRNSHGVSTLGLRFLRQHLAIFDFRTDNLYLSPGASFGEKENFDMSGLHLVRFHGETIVYAVDSNSPAATAGIQPGDALEKINNVTVDDLSLRQIRRELKSNDGRTVSLTIRHNNQLLDDRLELKKIL
jgi:predicted aspartyl protease